MKLKNDLQLAVETVESFYQALHMAGGMPSYVIKDIPGMYKFLGLCASNNIRFIYVPAADKEI